MDASPSTSPPGGASEAERRERIARLAGQLRACLVGLDDLELWKAGAHADLALTEVERHL